VGQRIRLNAEKEEIFKCLPYHLEPSLWKLFEEWKSVLKQSFEQDLFCTIGTDYDSTKHKELRTQQAQISAKLKEQLAFARHKLTLNPDCPGCLSMIKEQVATVQASPQNLGL